jgi:hypothetical protein
VRAASREDTAMAFRDNDEMGFRERGELTDDGSLRFVWTNYIGLAEAISWLEVLALGLVVG